MPSIIKKHCPNFGYPRGTPGRKGHKPIAIVEHIGGFEKDINWIMKPGTPASYHYFVYKDGRILELVDPDNAAWANGGTKGATWKHLKKGVNPNLYTISIAREGYNHHKPTKEQYESILWLHKKLMPEYDIPADRELIIGHDEITSSRWYCPGSGFPWAKLLADLKEVDKTYTVKKGDTLSAIGAEVGIPWQLIAEANNIKSPYTIFPEQKLILPEVTEEDEANLLRERVSELEKAYTALETENGKLKIQLQEQNSKNSEMLSVIRKINAMTYPFNQ